MTRGHYREVLSAGWAGAEEFIEQRAFGDAAHDQDIAGVDGCKLLPGPGQAAVDLSAAWRTFLPAFQDRGDIDLIPFEAIPGEHSIEVSSRAPYEGSAVVVLLATRRFSHQKDICSARPFTRHRMPPGVMAFTALATLYAVFKGSYGS